MEKICIQGTANLKQTSPSSAIAFNPTSWHVRKFKPIQGFLKEMACAALSSSCIFHSESPSLFKHQLTIRKLKIDQTGARELTKPAQRTGSPAHTQHQGMREPSRQLIFFLKAESPKTESLKYSEV